MVNDRHEFWWSQVTDNAWESHTFHIIDKCVSEQSICIDVGAWIGPISLYLGTKVQKVFAIEPDPEAFYDLDLNVSANRTLNIDIAQCAIANYTGTLQLGNNQILGNSVTRLHQSLNLFDVVCYTLSDFCLYKNITTVDFLKIDVEGCEELILEDIEFFHIYHPTVYVQLHNFWFTDTLAAVNRIRDVAKLYKNVYDDYYKKIDYHTIDGGSYIFTDLDL